MRTRRDDRGTVTIIVAVGTVAVLFVAGAFAVDLGNAFARQRALQTSADLAALAGVSRLGDPVNGITNARAAAIDSLCTGTNDNTVSGWPASTCSGSAWASDGNLANGEIQFFSDDVNGNGFYDDGAVVKVPNGTPNGTPRAGSNADERVTSGTATAIRVVAPTATVQFGLASAVGFSSVGVSKAATARIGSPQGAFGSVPFYMLDTDAANFCVRDQSVPFVPPPAPVVPPAPTAPATFVLAASSPLAVSGGFAPVNVGYAITVVIGPGASAPSPGQTTIFFDGDQFRNNGANQFTSASSAAGTLFTFIVPAGHTLGVPLKIWATVGNGNGAPVTNSVDITITAPAVADPCNATSANRGYIDEPRFSGNNQSLVFNIQQGMDHSLARWDSFPVGNPVPVANKECPDQAGTMVRSGPSTPVPVVNCVRMRTGQISGPAEQGFFDNSSGRLRQTGSCTGTTSPGALPNSPYNSGIDLNSLFQPAFVNPNSGATAAQIEAFVRSGAKTVPANLKGALSSAVLSCPRFAMAPVVSADPTTLNGTQYYPIIAVKYLWFDDDTYRGFQFSANKLVAIRAWVIEPDLLPDTVTGTAQVGHWTGDPSSPVVAQLVHDRDDPLPANP